MTPEHLANLLRLIAELYGQVATLTQQAAEREQTIEKQAARIAELEAAQPT